MSNFVERETPEFPEKTHTFSPGREGKQHSHHIWHCSGWSRPSHKGGGGGLPFGPHFGLKIWGRPGPARAPRPPPLDPLLHWVCRWFLSRSYSSLFGTQADNGTREAWPTEREGWWKEENEVERRLADPDSKSCAETWKVLLFIATFFSITLCVPLDRVSVVVRDFKIQRVTKRDQHQFSPDNISRS